MLTRSAIIRKCGVCLNFLYQYGAGFGRRDWATAFWSDGKVCFLNRIADPELVVCPHCRSLLWINEMEHHGEVFGPGKLPVNPVKAALYQEPTFKDYAALLEEGAGSGEKERYARQAWCWAGNDARRRPDSRAPGPGFRERSNMAALAELLSEADPGDLVLKAELMRELGCFAEGLSLLERLVGHEPVAGRFREWGDLIKRLIRQGDTRVALVWERG